MLHFISPVVTQDFAWILKLIYLLVYYGMLIKTVSVALLLYYKSAETRRIILKNMYQSGDMLQNNANL